MLSDEELDRMLRESDPVRSTTLVAPDAPAGMRVLARARRSNRRRRTRRLVAVPCVAAALLGATAATYGWVAGDGKGHSLESTAVDCHLSSMHDLVMNFDVKTESPLDACRREWKQTFGVAAPTRLSACVDSSPWGSIQVYPGGPEQCRKHRSDPYVGPTPEQLQLAHFRAALADRFPGRTCIPYPEMRSVIAQLLPKYRLTTWTTRHFQTASKEPEGACAEISYYDEPRRTIYLGDHVPGDPMSWP